MYTLYILRCADNSLYTGITKDLKTRIASHQSGKGSKYVRSRIPVTVVYTEVYPHRSAASKREYIIKQLSKSEKEALIA